MKKHRFLKSLGAAFLLEAVLILILQLAGKILIDPSEVVENVVLFVIWWSFFTLIFFHSDKILKNRSVVVRILSLLALLILAIVVDSYFQIPDNPLTITLITVFFLGLVYLVLPAFFRKYAMVIGGIYLLILAYFTYARLSMDYVLFTAERKETAILLFFIPIPFVALLLAYEQWKWVKSLQAAKMNAELAQLKAQVSPHFFFNTLNNLYALTVNKSEKAPDVVLKLSDIMRYTIYEGEKETVQLAEEVEYLENYIELNDLRYKKNVKVSFEKDISGEARIVPLLFIVLLENAYKHGVETLRDEAFISITLKSDGHSTEFSIENNFEKDNDVDSGGIGIVNLRERLKLAYPGRHTLGISESDNLFKVNLRIDH